MPLIDVRTALLQALVSGDSYGLELIDRVRESTKGHVLLLEGRIYPALRELESDGMLESYEGPPLRERGGRPRRYYKLTAEGRKVARQEARSIYGLLKPALGVS
jgi:PadR family transcriptional regulator PadR